MSDHKESGEVLKHWNLKLKTHNHRSLAPDIVGAVKYNLKQGWSVDDMCQAITNYAAILQSPNYSWTYGKWSLATFLKVGAKEDTGLRWVKHFSPNNFRAVSWRTDKARRDVANKVVAKPKPKSLSETEEAEAKAKLEEAKKKVFGKVESPQMSEQDFQARKQEQLRDMGLGERK